MAKVKFFTKEVEQTVVAHARKNLTRAAIIVEQAAKANVRKTFKNRRGSAGLGGSIGHEVDLHKMKAFVGTNQRYAAVHEVGTAKLLGGPIRPRNSKKLTIPVSPEAKKSRGARFMPDLEYIPRKGRNDLLARIDENDHLDVHWVLVDGISLQARPYLRPALLKSKAKVTRALTKPVPGTKQGSN